MQASGAPGKIYLPFANSGSKNTIPVASQISTIPNGASYTDGFPPSTLTPVAGGGMPPRGEDFNGILNAITAVQLWQSGGGIFTYDATWSSDNGGYPKGALLLKADNSGFWLSLSDNNTTDPDTGGAGWLGFDPITVQGGGYSAAVDSGAANAYAMTLSPAPAALTPGMVVTLQSIANTSTGAATLNVNGTGALPIYKNGAALPGGELVLGDDARLQLNEAGTAWNLIFTTTGLFAAINGDATQAFKVADAVNANEAPSLGQFLSVANTTAGSGTLSTSVSFTAPCNGAILLVGQGGGYASASLSQTGMNSFSTNGNWANATSGTIAVASGVGNISAGASVTATMTIGNSNNPVLVSIYGIFIPSV